MKFTLSLLDLDLAHFLIEDSNHSIKEDSTNLNDFRPVILGGNFKNQYFIEFTINTKIFKQAKVCSITTFSRFEILTENFDLIENIKDENVINLLSQLGLISNSHLMGMLKLKSEKTIFSEYNIPVTSIYELESMIKSFVNNN